MIEYYDNHIIINIKDNYVKQVNIGKFIVCEIPKENNLPDLKSFKQNE